ncbi:group 1 truncated hemoglobin [Mucilaginibacter gotjawali]|uniref:Uncharacterized protein n=2 Tax=Mucilaginibacter gotjawali TaxID=1550579 RepID=A0A839SFE6_9SPHI|nr:group 1 truncated hemoglobin [Mucilaginibacter gotjawali]MBB3056278.1 hypothetical protein [Mucilaginibacter gotjawali]BAU54982.1 hypothetical protein MgSA37_03162 [Mucilaginibacter gotjawali]
MKKLTFLPIALAAFFCVLLIESCSKNSSTTPVKTTIGTTLYDTLGGTTLVADPTHAGAMIEKGRLSIRNVIDSTIFVIAADSKINGHFTVLLSEVTKGDLSGFTDLSENLTTFVAGATGAKDFIYIGLNMHDAHNPATNDRMNGKATNADFDAFVADLVAGANKNKVPSSIINSLGKIVESLRTTVVQM